MQIDTTKETHDSSTTLWIAMFDSAASLVRSIAGTLRKMHAQSLVLQPTMWQNRGL